MHFFAAFTALFASVNVAVAFPGLNAAQVSCKTVCFLRLL